jgi:hypothetical protein
MASRQISLVAAFLSQPPGSPSCNPFCGVLAGYFYVSTITLHDLAFRVPGPLPVLLGLQLGAKRKARR